MEELSLHQQELEKIELLDQCCRELKILYLQNNVISRIENLGRMKELNYLNLALNNVTVIENLEGCENLRKLDLTVNFVGDLRTVNTLKGNRELKELYLTGNPCTKYDGYRAYVVHTLPMLEKLDGVAITRSERLQAAQEFQRFRESIEESSAAYAEERARLASSEPFIEELPEDIDIDEEEKRFWQEHSDFTPEARLEAQRRYAAIKARKDQKENPKQEKPKRRLYRDGRPLNINEGDWEFVLEGQDSDEQNFVLDITSYRYLDTSMIDLDVHPTHVCVTMKGKIFQLVLPEEINPDSEHCKAERSQLTGHLRLVLPKARAVVAPKGRSRPAPAPAPASTLLEIPDAPPAKADFANIVRDAAKPKGLLRATAVERPNDAEFVDCDDVPPLE